MILHALANSPAAHAGLRRAPIDAGNRNRLFPADSRGILSAKIAHYAKELLMRLAVSYPPSQSCESGQSGAKSKALISFEGAVDLACARVLATGSGRNSTARTVIRAANRKGVVNVRAKLGAGGDISPDTLKCRKRGLRRILHRLGMLPHYTPDQTRGTRARNADASVYAYVAVCEDAVCQNASDAEPRADQA